ncbi:hypothetical protein CPC08DRAFT_368081 [Agrocybe pediades]|nr:hypothetical protein CPC08DRAFT_368081 [Agrocybe pediades]
MERSAVTWIVLVGCLPSPFFTLQEPWAKITHSLPALLSTTTGSQTATRNQAARKSGNYLCQLHEYPRLSALHHPSLAIQYANPRRRRDFEQRQSISACPTPQTFQ